MAVVGAVINQPTPKGRLKRLVITLGLSFFISLPVHADCLYRAPDGKLFTGKVILTDRGVLLVRKGAPDLFFKHHQVLEVKASSACQPPSHTLTEAGIPPPRRIQRKKYQGQPVTLSVENARLQDVIQTLAEIGQLNYIVTKPLNETVNLRVKSVPWDQLLDLLSRMYRFSYQIRNGILTVGPFKDPPQKKN